MSEETSDSDNGALENGECEKCMSEIPIKADRCPDCGYEPSDHGIVGGILLALIAMGSILLAGLLLIVWIVTIASPDFGLSGGLTLTAFFGIFLVPMVWIVWKSANAERKSATGHMRDWDEIT